MSPRKTAFALAISLVAVPATANAPPDQYNQFDRNAATITDAFTQLEWERRPSTSTLAFGVAGLRCGTTVFSGGRLPTAKELLTILDEEPHDEYESGGVVAKMIDQAAFPDAPISASYWTSTPAGTSGDVWTIDFKTGAMTPAAKTAQHLVRCVR